MINKPPPVNGLSFRIPDIIRIIGRAFINQGSTFALFGFNGGFRVLGLRTWKDDGETHANKHG